MGFLVIFEKEKNSILPDQIKSILEFAGFTNFASVSRLSVDDLLESVRGAEEIIEGMNLKGKDPSDFIESLIKPFTEPKKFRFLPGQLAMLEELKQFAKEMLHKPNLVSS